MRREAAQAKKLTKVPKIARATAPKKTKRTMPAEIEDENDFYTAQQRPRRKSSKFVDSDFEYSDNDSN